MYQDFRCASIGGQVMSGCSRRFSLDWTQDLPFGSVICDGGTWLKDLPRLHSAVPEANWKLGFENQRSVRGVFLSLCDVISGKFLPILSRGGWFDATFYSVFQ